MSIHSDGGVHLTLPENWTEVAAHEHLSALVGERSPDEVMAPTCLVNDHPGHLDPATWWASLQAGSDGPLLLDVADHDDGFSATYALVTEPLSSTGHVRVRWLPGRSLLVTVAFDSDRTTDRLPMARFIVASVEVEGLP